MATLTVEGTDLVVRLRPWERLVTGTPAVRAPLTAVEKVSVTRAPWRVLRGEKERGLQIPGRLCLGVWRHPQGRDFVALRPFGDVVVTVDLRHPSAFARVAVHCAAAPRTAAMVRAATDGAAIEADTSTEDAPAAAPPAREPVAWPALARKSQAGRAGAAAPHRAPTVEQGPDLVADLEPAACGC